MPLRPWPEAARPIGPVGAALTACLLSAIGISCWNLMPVILGAAADAHALDDQALGLLGSTLLGGWLFATVVSFYRLPVVSRHLALTVGAALAASGFALALLTNHLWGLYAAWGVAGMGAAMVYCVSIQTIAELGYVERAFGLKVSAEVISGALLLFAFPVLLIASWGFPGAMYGIAAVYLLAAVLTPWVRAPVQREASVQPISAIPLRPWLALLALFVFMCGITGIWAFMERIGRDIGVEAAQLGTIFALLKVVGGAAGVTAAFAGNRFGMLWPHWTAFFAVGGAVVVLHLADGSQMFAAGAWIWEFGFTLGFAYQCAALVRLDHSQRLLLLIPSCIGLSGVVGPALAGFARGTYGDLGVYAFAATCSLVAAVMFNYLLAPLRAPLKDIAVP